MKVHVWYILNRNKEWKDKKIIYSKYNLSKNGH